jgi:hypothetical protein
MRAKPNKYVLVTVSVLMACVLLFVLGDGCQKTRLLLELRRGLSYDDFELAGRIVDEAGNPMSDVLVDLETGRLKKMATRTETTNEFVRVSNSFHFIKRDYSNVYLHFSKRGYSTVQLGFDKGGAYTNLKVVMHPSKDK